MFDKLLIANRGEIACRVAATARRMGVRTVAVYSDADAEALHVRLCDEAVRLGPAPAKDSYLRADLILQAARFTGAQAVHPGYGFLSENAAFAQACQDAGLVFVGPPPQAIAAMGSKSAAKALMEKAGVPLVPGYHGQRQEAAFLQAEADRIGYPVLIKASAGGGGKGMRIVRRPEEFEAALASCRREAAASFGDDQVLVERYLQRPRHIEVQVFADARGQAVHLFERDCSVQRRHQKVLEEAPAPGMTAERRRQMGEAAVAAARSVGYVGAGTVEFIAEHDVADSGRFYFMEMNTRLQVEHPVTEAITGLDLVEWQLRVAAGEPLPLRQDELALEGHAIEARICAENPARQFLPAVGRLALMRTPAAAAFERAPVRLDSGVREGGAITAHYDSMIAKLIVWAPDRAQALSRLDAALAQLHISDLGQGSLQTNVDFLRRVLGTRSFREADLDTALIDREHAALFAPQALAQDRWLMAGAVAARLWHDGQDGHGGCGARAGSAAHAPAAPAGGPMAGGHLTGHMVWTDPWTAADAWRLQPAGGWQWLDLRPHEAGDGEAAAPALHAAFRVLDAEGRLLLRLEGQERALNVMPLGADAFSLAWADCTVDAAPGDAAPTLPAACRVTVYRQGSWVEMFAPQGHAAASLIDPLQRASDHDAHGGRLVTQMPGRVLAVLVQPGQKVARGEALVVTEAMKMEHTMTAPHDGIVGELLCRAGEQVAEGAELLRLAPMA